MAAWANFVIPESCPFSIQKIQLDGATSSDDFLIRERDQYGEFPHIYAKLCSGTPSVFYPGYSSLRDQNSGAPAHTYTRKKYNLIVLSDTGCGTEVPNDQSSSTTFPSMVHDGTLNQQPQVLEHPHLLGVYHQSGREDPLPGHDHSLPL